MFRDRVKISIKAGKGGNGKVSFYANRKPSGGVGGDGGNVYLEGSSKIYDLSYYSNESKYDAENAIDGGETNLKGRNGKDLILKVPLATYVYDKEGNLITVVSKDQERVQILRGGRGGLGNWFYRTKGLEFLNRGDKGHDGEVLDGVIFELELFSDILLIGFPNAGKSSLMNAITNSKSEVASYEFTTLNPQLGRMNGITIMDLPGLIEGTYEGKGLGTKFVKHTRSAKLIAHLVSLESEDIVDSYKRIHKELKNIDPELVLKTEIIVLSKSDLIKKEELDKKIELMKQFNKKIFVISVYDYDSLEVLKNALDLEVKILS